MYGGFVKLKKKMVNSFLSPVEATDMYRIKKKLQICGVLFSLWLDLVVPREKENEQDLRYPIFLPRKYHQALQN